MSAYQELKQIEVALQNDIEDLMRNPDYDDRDDVIYLLQIKMARDQDGVWQPRLVILCGTEELCNYLNARLFSRSVVTSRLIRPPLIQQGNVRSSADQEPALLYRDSAATYDNSILGSQWSVRETSNPGNEYRISERYSDWWNVTVGGSILVDDVPYGLTTGHYETNQLNRSYVQRSPSMANRLSASSNNTELEGTRNDTFIIDEIMSMQTLTKLGGQERRLPCLIVTHHGLWPALVEVETSTMVMNGGSFHVLEIAVAQELPVGCSGSWVILNGKLLGTIIAVQRAGDEMSQAFALPIESTFSSIKAAMNATRVELPSNVETRISELVRSSPVSMQSESAMIELDLLYAMRQSEKSCRDLQFSFRGPFPGTGWVGIRREEVLQMRPSFTDAITDAKLKTRTYESLTGLKMETIRSLVRIGHIFPAHRVFCIGMREWVAEHKVSHLRGPRAIAVRLILQECLGTEAGENLLGLICTLKILLQVGEKHTKSRSLRQARDERRTIWIRILFCSLFKILEILSTEIPSETQLHAFMSHCILGFKGVPELRLNEHYHSQLLEEIVNSGDRQIEPFHLPEVSLYDLPRDEKYTHENLFSVDFLARMLLQLSDVAHSRGEKILICSGYPWAFWARAVAQVLGIGVHTRSRSDEGEFGASATSDISPSVFAFTNISSAVSEVMNRDELPSGLGTVSYDEAVDEMMDLWNTASRRKKAKGKRLMTRFSWRRFDRDTNDIEMVV
ncbi:hypothetical protein CcaCcLH18_08454 [Colletotrichum camelliae]|nr:hypothetical protein CcaCcLH18_08454 [Colletotrichum camelliae]